MVRADETSRAALEDAQQLLSACGDIKLLLNAGANPNAKNTDGTTPLDLAKAKPHANIVQLLET